MKKVLIIMISILSIATIVLGTYFLNNYNKFILYEFIGEEDGFIVSGKAIFTGKYQTLDLHNISYKLLDKMIKEINVSLVFKEDKEEYLMFRTKSKEESGKTFSLQQYLATVNIELKEWKGYNEMFPPTIEKKFKDSVYLKIEMTDENNIKSKTTIKINSTKYANDKWFYKRVSSIS